MDKGFFESQRFQLAFRGENTKTFIGSELCIFFYLLNKSNHFLPGNQKSGSDGEVELVVIMCSLFKPLRNCGSSISHSKLSIW